MAKDNKNLKIKEQPKQEPSMLTREQYNEIVRADTVKKVNQFLRGMGTIFVVIVYFLMAEFLWEISWFGLISASSRDEHHMFWKFISSDVGSTVLPDYSALGIDYAGKIFDDYFKWGNWIPKACMTVFLVLLTIGIAYIIAFSINDIIGMIKNILVSSKRTMVDISQTATSNIGEGLGIEGGQASLKPKKLFDDDLPENIKQQSGKVKQPKTKKNKDETINSEFNDIMKTLLTAPHTEKEQKIVDMINQTPTETIVGGARVDEE